LDNQNPSTYKLKIYWVANEEALVSLHLINHKN